jgi:hypothetical protein
VILTGGVVQPPSNIAYSDGDEIGNILGKSGELIVAGLHGNLYTETYRGRMFHGYSTTSTTIPISSTTAPTFILYNPRSSNINCVLVHYCPGWESGTNVEGNVMFGVITNAPGAIATGASISAFTDGPVLNGLLGGGLKSQVRFGIAATLGAAATQFLPLGMSIMVLAAAKATPVDLFYDFNGTVIVPPGVAVFSCASAATSAKYNERLSWYEFPL